MLDRQILQLQCLEALEKVRKDTAYLRYKVIQLENRFVANDKEIEGLNKQFQQFGPLAKNFSPPKSPYKPSTNTDQKEEPSVPIPNSSSTHAEMKKYLQELIGFRNTFHESVVTYQSRIQLQELVIQSQKEQLQQLQESSDQQEEELYSNTTDNAPMTPLGNISQCHLIHEGAPPMDETENEASSPQQEQSQVPAVSATNFNWDEQTPWLIGSGFINRRYDCYAIAVLQFRVVVVEKLVKRS